MWVMADIWYGSAENLNFIMKECKRDFIVPLKEKPKGGLERGSKKSKAMRVDWVAQARAGQPTPSVFEWN
jgi:hypothetical protein